MQLEELRFCVKYPFTQQARSLLESVDFSKISDDVLDEASKRIGLALSGKSFFPTESEINASKESSLTTILYYYPIARAMISLTNDNLIKRKFARAIRDDTYNFLKLENMEFLENISKQLFKVQHKNERFQLSMIDYLVYLPNSPEYRLINIEMKEGQVLLTKDAMAKVISSYIYSSILQTKTDKLKLPKMFSFFAEEIKKKYKKEEIPEDLGPVETKHFPPCMKHIGAELLDPDILVSHQPRFVMATFFTNINMDLDKGVDFFRLQSNFNEAKTRYSLEHAYGKRGGGTKYSVPSCSKMESYGLCYRDKTCLWPTPLIYYRNRKSPRRVAKKVTQ
jgi:DNA primase large subunit